MVLSRPLRCSTNSAFISRYRVCATNTLNWGARLDNRRSPIDRIYFPPSFRGFEPRRRAFSTWSDHVSFGYDIVEAVRPAKVVELGAYNGMSFFVFCQSMIENDISGLCYAVDTWGGDDHTGEYDDSVFDDVRQHARDHYRGNTYLMRMLFNDAVGHFEDETIDLLHIDGLHTYEAVHEDFNNWYSKVSPGGIILFHDIEARQSDFGVWRFWAELEAEHETFAFQHGFGLGVLRKPGGDQATTSHPLLDLLFNGSDQEHHRLRQLYIYNSEYLEARNKAKRLKGRANKGGDGKGVGQKPPPAQAPSGSV